MNEFGVIFNMFLKGMEGHAQLMLHYKNEPFGERS
jgi:hypothetical protein